MSAPRSHPPSDWASASPLGDDVYWIPVEADEGRQAIVWHWCTRDNADKRSQWAGARTSGHQHVSFDPLHLEPSLACADCPWHGYVRDGKWAPV